MESFVIKLKDLLKEDTYSNFLAKEQEIFMKKPTYSEYVNKVRPFLVQGDKKSEWLFNHHAAEIAWEDRRPVDAKRHIEIAVKNNPLPSPWPAGLARSKNAITHILDFIINQRGTKADLQSAISRIGDSLEKRTAQELLNDPKYGGKLK